MSAKPDSYHTATNGRREDVQRWDAISRGFSDLYRAPSTQYYRRCEIALLERYAGPLAGKRVLKLDLWNEANNTRILHWISERAGETYGLDLSRVTATRALDNSRRSGHDVRVLRADIREIPFASESFDLVYTMGTIEHIPDYQLAVDETCRVLKVGGRAIIGVPYKWDVFLRPLIVKVLELVGKYPYSPEKAFTAPELQRVVERAGLHVQHRTGILTMPGLIRMADLLFFRHKIPLYHLTPALCWPFERLETRWPWCARFGYLMAMVADRVDVQRGRNSANGVALHRSV